MKEKRWTVYIPEFILPIEPQREILEPISEIKLGLAKNEEELVSIASKVDTILVPGNHDSNIEKLAPKEINLVNSTGVVIENVLLTHGHTLPSENFAHVDKIIMGHIHPVFFQENSVLNGQRVWVTIKTEKQNIFPSHKGQLEITILPSFNKYFYATHKKYYKKSISPIIEKIKEITSAKILTLDGSIIGDESLIRLVI